MTPNSLSDVGIRERVAVEDRVKLGEQQTVKAW